MLNYTKKHVNTITICVTMLICIILFICLDVLVFNAPDRIDNQNKLANFSRIEKIDGTGNNQSLNKDGGPQNLKTESDLRSYCKTRCGDRARYK